MIEVTPAHMYFSNTRGHLVCIYEYIASIVTTVIKGGCVTAIIGKSASGKCLSGGHRVAARVWLVEVDI